MDVPAVSGVEGSPAVTVPPALLRRRGFKACFLLRLRIPEHPAGHSDNIRPPKPGYLATLV